MVEDEAHLAEGAAFQFGNRGIFRELTGSGEDALDLLLQKEEHFEALILDVMLPGKDGFAVSHELRKAQNYIPLLMLTARSRPEDVLQGFESGADDYLAKPFDLAILLARVESLLRRKNWLRNAAPDVSSPARTESDATDTFQFDDKVADFQNLQLRVGQEVFQLTLMESELLRYLIRNAGKPCSRKAILQDVWNLNEETDTRAIDNFIVRLRHCFKERALRSRSI